MPTDHEPSAAAPGKKPAGTLRGPDGALYVGAPETVAKKIAKVARALELSRFDLKYSLGTLPHEKLMESLRLYAPQVVPRARRAMG